MRQKESKGESAFVILSYWITDKFNLATQVDWVLEYSSTSCGLNHTSLWNYMIINRVFHYQRTLLQKTIVELKIILKKLHKRVLRNALFSSYGYRNIFSWFLLPTVKIGCTEIIWTYNFESCSKFYCFTCFSYEKIKKKCSQDCTSNIFFLEKLGNL